jgi:hypothetical protein
MNFSDLRQKIQNVRTDISPTILAQIYFEALFYPFLILFWAGWNRFNRYLPLPKIKEKNRQTKEDEKVFICLHDWLGYSAERSKTLKNGLTFSCGRAKILREISESKNKISYEIIISLSGNGNYDFDVKPAATILRVENRGKDFRGYSLMLREIIKSPGNPFVVLMNSSVSGGFYDGWLDDYCAVVKKDRSIGLLGISTRARYPGLLKNHFVPHLQSFFLIATKEVFSLILENNNGMLPGVDERNKYRLIQKGEIGLSLEVLKLGFAIASVYRGNVHRFKLQNRYGCNIHDWPFPLEDIRLTSAHQQPPNSLSKIEQQN